MIDQPLFERSGWSIQYNYGRITNVGESRHMIIITLPPKHHAQEFMYQPAPVLFLFATLKTWEEPK